MPLVSVIMPAFNSEHFIKGSIESALRQTLGDLEVLVSDDASTDGTCGIIEELARRDSRVQLLTTERNGGPATARNRAIEAARGRYIAFLDSDDLWLPHKLERQVSAMESDGRGFCYSGYEIIDENCVVRGRAGVPEVVTYQQLLRNNVIGCLTAIYDCRAIGKVYAPLIGREDFGLWLSILRQIYKGYGINEVLAQRRLHRKSLSARKRRVIGQNWQLYRHEGLGVLNSLCFFGGYVAKGLVKTYSPKTALKLGWLHELP